MCINTYNVCTQQNKAKAKIALQSDRPPAARPESRRRSSMRGYTIMYI